MAESVEEIGQSARTCADLITPEPTITTLTVVVPTRNEADNVEPLLDRLERALPDVDTTVIFVDDSDDTTPQCVLDATLTYTSSKFRPILLHRAGRDRVGGLSG